MKRFLLILICLLPLSLLAENPIDDDCTFNGIPLRGKVYIYPSIGLEDFRVCIVASGTEDLKVHAKTFCDEQSECGEWQFVDNPGLADFTIAIVDKAYSDFTISYFPIPGINK